MCINEFLNILTNNFNINNNKITYYTNKTLDNKYIKKVAILPGSGRDFIEKIINENCDLYISSDLSHHDILDLYENDISYINSTHYGLKKLFCYYMKEILENIFDDNENIKIYQFNNEDF